MLFWLKKVISFWLMPAPLCLSALVVGLLLLRSTRRRRLGRGLVIAAVGLLLIASNKFVAKSLLRPLETIYPAMPEFVAGTPLPPDLAACRFVVVLGGGHGRTPGVAANNVLSTASLARVVEGIRILRALPAARLIVTGGADPGYVTTARMLGRAAQAFGITPDRILYLEEARDTEDESRAVKGLAQDAPVALVTSAWHLPRAVALFRSAGLTTVPCPAGYNTQEDAGFALDDYLWDVGAIGGTTLALRERLGYLWIWLRSKA